MNIIADCTGKSRIRYGFSGTMKGKEGRPPWEKGAAWKVERVAFAGRSGEQSSEMYGYPYNLRKNSGVCNNSVRKCTEKSYGIFARDILYLVA